MSTLKIEERFELDADPDEAWAYLTHPERIIVCLPGAELTEVVDERNFAGGVKVKLGAVAMEYRGTAEFTEVDHEQRVIRMEGKGRERRGGGTVTLTMEGTVHELEDGRCEVTVVADIQLAGKIVRFGRGMIQAVTAEIFKEFTTRLAAELATGKLRGEKPAAVLDAVRLASTQCMRCGRCGGGHIDGFCAACREHRTRLGGERGVLR